MSLTAGTSALTKWKVVPLGSVVSMEKAKNGSPLPYVGLEDISSSTGEFTGSTFPAKVKSDTFHFTPRHVLYGRLRAYLNKVLLPAFEGHCSTEIFPLLPCEKLDRNYLFHWLTWSKTCDRIAATATGARMPRANMNEVMGFDIPLPPADKQKQIVAVLDQAFAALDLARAHAKANLEDMEILLAEVVQSSLEKLEADYGLCALGEAADFKNGFAFKSQKFRASGQPVIRISNIQKGVIDLDGVVFSDQVDYSEDLSKYFVSPGELLIAMSGATTGKIGFNRSDKTLLQNQRVGRFCKNSALNLEYLAYFLQTKISEHLAISAGAAQPNLSTKQIHEVMLPVPPKHVQDSFVVKLDVFKNLVHNAVRNYEKAQADIANLRQSLLQKAFSGQLP